MSRRSPGRAVIDVGTNTVLMVAGRRLEDGSVQVLDDAHAIARLGRGVDAHRRLQPESMARACAVLRRYRDRARAVGATQVTAYGTSALRDAANRDEFIDRVRREAGIELTLVSGEEEAALTFRGAAFGLDLPPRYGVLDIGGGSTELALGGADGVHRTQSVDVGAVRVTERHFAGLPPTGPELAAAGLAIRAALADLTPHPPDVPLVGVAGTVTTLGALDRGLTRFDADELNGHLLSDRQVGSLSQRLLGLSLADLRAMPQIEDERADIISAGSLILRLALGAWTCPGIIVSTRGIRYGLLLRALGL